MFQQLQNLIVLVIGIACSLIVSIKGDQFCTSFSCGSNGVNFSYPFWSKDERDPGVICGYSDLGIDCSNGNPILSIEEVDYLVISINYTNQSLRVVNTLFVGQTCPRPEEVPSIGTLYPSPENNRYLYYFSKCSQNPPISLPYLPCAGSNPANRSYVFEKGADAIPDIYSWNSKCNYSCIIPVLRSAPNLSNNGSNYGSILELGTELVWDVNSECAGCEKDHYQCGFFTAGTSYGGYDYNCYCISNGYIQSNCQNRAGNRL